MSAVQKIVFNSWDTDYKKPFGAVRTGDKCTFSIRLPKDLPLDYNPAMVFYRTGFRERFLTMEFVREESDCNVYSVDFFPVHTDLHYYYFAVTSLGQRFYIKKTSANTGEMSPDGSGSVFQLTVYDKSFNSPDFLKGGIIYQIFPDRFAKADISTDNVPEDRIIRDDWFGTPYYAPDSTGMVRNNDYFGGNLKGIESKLDYLADLGVTCIYLNPIFEAHENHRYNTANYEKVDPLLGTNDDFEELCDKARQKGISVILDGVFSHTGADSIYFNKFGRYDTIGAYNSSDSPYYDWYNFISYPDVYDSWWGFSTLPNVQENNPKFTEYICGKGGILDYWTSLGARGFRLDVADELPDKFLENLNKCVKKHSVTELTEDGEEKTDTNCIIGEVWEDASNKEAYGIKRRYLLGFQLDTVMNYPFRDAISSYVMGGSAENFANSIMVILENYPKPSIDCLMNFVSTHDTERAITRYGGIKIDEQRKDLMAEHYLSPTQYAVGKNRLKVATLLTFFLPGVPSVYYGDEVGSEGYKDPFNRRCYPWGKEDFELLDYFKELSEIRRENEVFKDGTLKFLNIADDVLVFARYSSDLKTAVLVYVNRTGVVQSLPKEKNIIKIGTYEHLDGSVDEIGTLHINPYGYAISVNKL
ncbi:MAG: glycoside hydrolase family 13 protein [Ruminococcus sp.]|nr:glycoside hydrolase family 13 protein [Ruminococcus sp.]